MPKAIKFTRDGDYRFHEIDNGRDETIWLDLVEFDDGSTLSVEKHDPRRERWIAEAEDDYEPPAHMLDDGRDFSPPYEP